MSYRLIISDIDGCISPEESRAWDFDQFEEICRLSHAASAGTSKLPPMTLCTGRPQPYVEALMKIMDIRYPVICENGAVMYDLESNRAYFAPGVTSQKIAQLRALRSYIDEQIVPKYPGLIMQFGKEAQMAVYSQTPEVFGEVRELIADFARRQGGPELVLAPTHYYLNISLAGVDKGSGIRHLLDTVKFDKSELAGIGDTVVDLAIRERVAFFACPQNATAEVKAAADYVSPYPAMKGVVDILHRLMA